MLLGGTGKNAIVDHGDLVRGDNIHWLDRAHNDIHENSFFDLMDRFVKYLNENCYTGINIAFRIMTEVNFP